MIHVYPVMPVSAPRQVRKDAYDPSPHVKKYRAYRDELKIRRVFIPEAFHHTLFVLPVSTSWSARQKREYEGMPHQHKPDRDNLEKALLDSVYGEDCHVWDGRTTKLWGERGLLIISSEPMHITLPFDLSGFYAAAARSERNYHARADGYAYAPLVPI